MSYVISEKIFAFKLGWLSFLSKFDKRTTVYETLADEMASPVQMALPHIKIDKVDAPENMSSFPTVSKNLALMPVYLITFVT